MLIRHLSLTNFRNYRRLDLRLPDGVTLLQGANAQGKTNFLEAIYYMATTRSPYSTQEEQLLHWDVVDEGDPLVVGRIVMHLETESGVRHLEMRLIREVRRGQPSLRREALVDRRKLRLLDLLGNLRVVLFLPQDVNLISGPPSERRRYLDITLCQSDRQYCQSLSAYNKLLDQRNALLRNFLERRPTAQDLTLLDVYTSKLIDSGSIVLARRAAFAEALSRAVQRVHYEELTAERETLILRYLPRLRTAGLQRQPEAWREMAQDAAWLNEHAADPSSVRNRLQRIFADARDEEVSRGRTLIGPHRDDWRFWVNGRRLELYGSRGQQRTAILALKMAEVHWIASATDTQPVVLLDDVMAELDAQRRRLLQAYIVTLPQAIVTTTDSDVFSTHFLERVTQLQVESGRITPMLSSGRSI